MTATYNCKHTKSNDGNYKKLVYKQIRMSIDTYITYDHQPSAYNRNDTDLSDEKYPDLKCNSTRIATVCGKSNQAYAYNYVSDNSN